ncbi:hypothetical protein Tco_1148022 [Tanacetum coccineum]
MAVLESCPKHNMVAYLEKSEGNAEFHEVIDFLARSSIYHALTVSPVVSTTFVEQFRMSAKSKIINSVRYITAKVAGKPVSIFEASIRSDLLFDDANGIDSLPNQTDDAQDVGRIRDAVNEKKENAKDEVSTEDVLSTAQQNVSTDKEKVSTDRPKVSTDRPKVSTDGSKFSTNKEKDSTDRTDEGTDDQTEGRRTTQTIQTTTSTMFGDDETIAQVLLNMSHAKAVSREKE